MWSKPVFYRTDGNDTIYAQVTELSFDTLARILGRSKNIMVFVSFDSPW